MTTKTIHELSDELKISVRKLNVMASRGYLNFKDEGKRALPAQMRYSLSKGRMLTAEHLLMLIRKPDLIEGLDTLAGKAKAQIRSLGDVANEGLGEGFAYSLIYGAYISDPASLERLADWARRIIPADGCGYHYLATRMLWHVSEKQFKEAYAYVARAVVNLRRYPPMASYVAKINEEGMRFCNPGFDL